MFSWKKRGVHYLFELIVFIALFFLNLGIVSAVIGDEPFYGTCNPGVDEVESCHAECIVPSGTPIEQVKQLCKPNIPAKCLQGGKLIEGIMVTKMGDIDEKFCKSVKDGDISSSSPIMYVEGFTDTEGLILPYTSPDKLELNVDNFCFTDADVEYIWVNEHKGTEIDSYMGIRIAKLKNRGLMASYIDKINGGVKSFCVTPGNKYALFRGVLYDDEKRKEVYESYGTGPSMPFLYLYAHGECWNDVEDRIVAKDKGADLGLSRSGYVQDGSCNDCKYGSSTPYVYLEDIHIRFCKPEGSDDPHGGLCVSKKLFKSPESLNDPLLYADVVCKPISERTRGDGYIVAVTESRGKPNIANFYLHGTLYYRRGIIGTYDYFNGVFSVAKRFMESLNPDMMSIDCVLIHPNLKEEITYALDRKFVVKKLGDNTEINYDNLRWNSPDRKGLVNGKIVWQTKLDAKEPYNTGFGVCSRLWREEEILI